MIAGHPIAWIGFMCFIVGLVTYNFPVAIVGGMVVYAFEEEAQNYRWFTRVQ